MFLLDVVVSDETGVVMDVVALRVCLGFWIIRVVSMVSQTVHYFLNKIFIHFYFLLGGKKIFLVTDWLPVIE